jgi:hypothetical protein
MPMAARLVTVPPPEGGLYRLARTPTEPFAPPSWSRAHDDGTFGNRFDDPTADEGNAPEGRFRAIYCATQRAATFGETIARFRPSLSLLAKLEAIDDDEPLEESLAHVTDPDDVRRGLVSADWRMRRRIGHTLLDPSLVFVDIAAAETMQHLRTALAPLAARLRLADIDLSSLTSQQRRFTQGAARYVYDQRDAVGMPRFAGIRYPSRLTAEWECWAVFDDRIRHVAGWPSFPATFFADDPDLLRVAAIFDLTIELFSGQPHYLRP